MHACSAYLVLLAIHSKHLASGSRLNLKQSFNYGFQVTSLNCVCVLCIRFSFCFIRLIFARTMINGSYQFANDKTKRQFSLLLCIIKIKHLRYCHCIEINQKCGHFKNQNTTENELNKNNKWIISAYIEAMFFIRSHLENLIRRIEKEIAICRNEIY